MIQSDDTSMRDSQATRQATVRVRQKVFQPYFLGRYCLVDQISKGGMSDIYLAKTFSLAGFQKPLVIKKLQPQYYSRPSYVKRFLNEAGTLARLNHSNIVQVLDMGIVEGEYYIAMEYIEGRNVAHVLSKAAKNGRRPPLEFVLHVVLEVGRGLAYSHRRKGPSGESLMLIHQDINAFNVMVSYEAEVKIIDFGIAQMFLEAGARDGLPVVGKLIYFSPEQLQKKPLDRRVDIYGTGVLLYELLTGKRLVDHQETVAETVKKILKTKVQEEVDKSDKIIPELKPILVKAMAFNPEDRYSWMEEMIEDLRGVVKKCSLELDSRKFALYMREQFPREILLDRRRLTKLLLEGPPKRTVGETPQAPDSIPDLPGLGAAAPQERLALSSWPFNEEAGFRCRDVQFFPKGVNVTSGKLIFRQGDPGTDIYVIVKGKVRLFLQLGDSRQTLAILGQGDFFAETALLDEPYRSVSALAEEDCRLVSLDREAFIKLFDVGLPRLILLNVLEKLRDARSLIESSLLEDNLSRLIYALLYFESRRYHRNGQDIDLEELLGFFRLPKSEQMEKYLKKLDLLDALRAHDKTIHIENTEKLESILNILSGRAKLVFKL